MKRLGGGTDFPKDTTPYVAYYRFKKSPKPHALEKVLVPGQEIDATYLHTFLESGKEGTEEVCRWKAPPPAVDDILHSQFPVGAEEVLLEQ